VTSSPTPARPAPSPRYAPQPIALAPRTWHPWRHGPVPYPLACTLSWRYGYHGPAPLGGGASPWLWARPVRQERVCRQELLPRGRKSWAARLAASRAPVSLKGGRARWAGATRVGWSDSGGLERAGATRIAIRRKGRKGQPDRQGLKVETGAYGHKVETQWLGGGCRVGRPAEPSQAPPTGRPAEPC
jgi:hypothetical protein